MTPLSGQSMPGQSAAKAGALDPQMIEQIKAQMADVIEPAAIGIWPLAWGWWLLIATAIALVVSIIVFLIAKHRKNRYRRLAIADLNQQTFSSFQEQCQFAMQLSKKVALYAYPSHRETIAKANGQAWVNWLNTHSAKPLFSDELATIWQEQLYKADTGLAVRSELTLALKSWILQHKAQSKGASYV